MVSKPEIMIIMSTLIGVILFMHRAPVPFSGRILVGVVVMLAIYLYLLAQEDNTRGT